MEQPMKACHGGEVTPAVWRRSLPEEKVQVAGGSWPQGVRRQTEEQALPFRLLVLFYSIQESSSQDRATHVHVGLPAWLNLSRN